MISMFSGTQDPKKRLADGWVDMVRVPTLATTWYTHAMTSTQFDMGQSLHNGLIYIYLFYYCQVRLMQEGIAGYNLVRPTLSTSVRPYPNHASLLSMAQANTFVTLRISDQSLLPNPAEKTFSILVRWYHSPCLLKSSDVHHPPRQSPLCTSPPIGRPAHHTMVT